MSVERSLSIKKKNWRKKWFTMKTTIIVSIIIIVASFIITFAAVFAGRLIPNKENIPLNASEDLIRTPTDEICYYDDLLTNIFWVISIFYISFQLFLNQTNCLLF